jgi:probable HAF family extracellular repeat protein
MSTSRKTNACLSALLAAWLVPAAYANTYTLEDLGHDVIPFDVNGHETVPAFRRDRAVVFREGHWHALHFQDHAGIARAVNERGDVVGNQGSEPILWASSRHRRVLALPGTAQIGSAMDVSDDRTAVGHFTFQDDIFHTHCFRTLADGTSTDLGLLAQGNTCTAHGINGRGEIVGEANVVPDGPVHPFLWRDGALRDLGTLGNGDMAIAFGIDSHGQVVGRSNVTPGGTGHAFVWRRGVMEDLGLSDFSETSANAINDQGEIVGDGVRVGDGAFRAVRFAGGAVIALEDEVEDLGDWLLISATSVNEEGVIVGEAVRLGDGQVHGFLLRPQKKSRPSRGG